MKFKKFFLERAYFTELLKNSVKIVNSVEKQLKKFRNIPFGTKVNAYGYDFIFYKGSARNEVATYDPNKDEIRIYVSRMHNVEDNLDFFKWGIPHKVKSIMMHELSHANEEANNFLGYGMYKNPKEYYNSRTELNSRLMEKIYYHLDDFVVRMAKYDNFNKGFQVLMKRILGDS